MTNPLHPPAKGARRLIWLGLGFAALGLGFVGVFLPVLPTTPFVLVAAFAFSRSSPRLEAWLVEHRVFGPFIADWRAHGAIAPRVKAIACTMMAAVFLISLWRGAPGFVLVLQVVLMGAGAAYVLTRPSGPRDGETT